MIETLSSVFPDFNNFTEIGRGGFSVVFSAVHSKVEILEIAIKAVNKYEILSADNKRNFELEVKILKRLDFPFIITFYDLRENNEFYFISMELAKKGTLLTILNEKKHLDKDTTLRVFCQLSTTLYYLHNVLNSIHRDIKIENIMFDEEMNVRLIDFGFSQIIKNKSKDPNKNKSNKIFTTLCGSYPYAAPEMLRLSPYSKPVDIWALGVVLYVCVVGQLPFDDPSIPKLAKMIVFNEPNYPEDIDEDLQLLLKKLLTKNPSERLTIDGIKEYELIKNSPYKIYFDVIGNENFMIKSFNNQSNMDDSNDEADNNNNNNNNNNNDETIDVYLDAEIIENLIRLGLDPSKVLSEGTEEILLYRALRKKKISKILGNDQLFKETLNQKNIPQEQLAHLTFRTKKQQKQQKNQDQVQNQQPSQQTQSSQQTPAQAQTQEDPNQNKVQRKNHHVEFNKSQQQQNQQQAKRNTQQKQNQDDEIFPNYQNFKQFKANQKSPQQLTQMSQPQLTTYSGPIAQQVQQQQQAQNQQQNPNQSLQSQIQQQIQLQLQQKPSNQTFHQQTYPLHMNTQRQPNSNPGPSEMSKTFMRVSRNKQRSSSVASIVKMAPVIQIGTPATPATITSHQPISKCSSSGQPGSQISYQGQQSIMVIQKKRRAPSLGPHMPSFKSAQSIADSGGASAFSITSTGESTNIAQTDRVTPTRKVRTPVSITDQTDGGRSLNHPQGTGSGREVAPIMRPRKSKGKGNFLSNITK